MTWCSRFARAARMLTWRSERSRVWAQRWSASPMPWNMPTAWAAVRDISEAKCTSLFGSKATWV